MTEWHPLYLTLKLAFITTLILLVGSVPLAYWLSYSRTRWRPVLESLVGMPLVLPPTVLGFYLLIAMSPSSPAGRWLIELAGFRLAFSFGGLVLGSVLYSLPFMVFPLQSGFSQLPPSLAEAAYVLGKSRTTTLFRVLLPNMKPSILAGIMLSFAHTVGEFGVVLMIGGNIPGHTRVASIAIYDAVEGMHYRQAHLYSLVLVGIAFATLLLVYIVNGRLLKKVWS
ncbi:MAG: hypothetical protein RLY31_212 [Bacteroidota bacterium]|jgi:molybdate transport system permease protein